MILFPAIDLLGGRCVRLAQGDFDRSTDYGDDPAVVAQAFVAAGAQWLHVVDLDAARRQGDNRKVIEGLAAAVPIPIQVGGGVRDGSLLHRGVARVVVGSLAVSDPEAVRRMAAEYPGRVAAGLDHRDGEVRVGGWTEGTAVSLMEALGRVDCPELAAVVVTEISRDGMLSGPDLDGLASVLASTATPVIASGGVSSVEDLEALAVLRISPADGDRRLAGAIVGRAIYEGRVDVAAGLQALGAGR
ncbi:MAG: HisA/HisF-related TIM barrel protein [Acidimicrobiales bacterium]